MSPAGPVAVTLHVAARDDRVIVTSPDLPGWAGRCDGASDALGDVLGNALAAAHSGQRRAAAFATIPPPDGVTADVAYVRQLADDGAVSTLAAWLELLVGDSVPRLVALVAAGRRHRDPGPGTRRRGRGRSRAGPRWWPVTVRHATAEEQEAYVVEVLVDQVEQLTAEQKRLHRRIDELVVERNQARAAIHRRGPARAHPPMAGQAVLLDG